ncbi:MAG: 4Fe-4S binding protein [Oligoflexia bacterium]|nr:4Fe-4S binding protein [Oligoflexia bacterium]
MSQAIKIIKLLLKYLIRTTSRYKGIVERYPDVVSAKTSDDLFPTYKGYLRNDLSKCTACGDCLTLCPVEALSFVENESSTEVKIEEFNIDLGRCYSCGLCVEKCPEKSLFFSKEFELHATNLNGLVMKLHGEAFKKEKDISRIRTYDIRR